MGEWHGPWLVPSFRSSSDPLLYAWPTVACFKLHCFMYRIFQWIWPPVTAVLYKFYGEARLPSTITRLAAVVGRRGREGAEARAAAAGAEAARLQACVEGLGREGEGLRTRLAQAHRAQVGWWQGQTLGWRR